MNTPVAMITTPMMKSVIRRSIFFLLLVLCVFPNAIPQILVSPTRYIIMISSYFGIFINNMGCDGRDLRKVLGLSHFFFKLFSLCLSKGGGRS